MRERTKKALLLDDEPAVLDSHALLFQLFPEFDIVTETNSVRAVNYLKNNDVDLLVFDVEMEGLNGLEILPLLNPKPKLLMVTAHQEYVARGWLHDVDFCLQKPLVLPELMKALSVLYDKGNTSRKVLKAKERYILRDKDTGMELVLLYDEISVVESKGNDIKIHLTGGFNFMQRKSLKDIYDLLPRDEFVQIHRSYIININNLVKFNRKAYKILMRDHADELKISDLYRDDFFKRYDTI